MRLRVKFNSAIPIFLMASVVIIFGLRRIWLSDILALASSIQDDSFYYILPGWFVSRVGFFSFDGITKTYGFQPLYEIWIGFLGLFAMDLSQLLRLTLTSNLLFHVTTGGLLYKLARSFSPRFLSSDFQKMFGILATTFWYVNSPLYLSQLTGKENALASLLLASVMLCFLRLRISNATSLVILFGLLSGFLLITRIHPATVLVLMLLWVWMYLLRSSNTASKWQFLRWSTLGAIIPVVGWCMYAEIAFNQIMPTSSLVKLGGYTLSSAFLKYFESLTLWRESLEYLFNAIKFSLGLESSFYLPQFDASPSIPNHFIALGWRERFFRCSILLPVISGLGTGLLLFRMRAIWSLLFLVAASLIGHWISFTLLNHRGEMYYYIWYIFDLPVFLPLIAGFGLTCFLQLLYHRLLKGPREESNWPCKPLSPILEAFYKRAAFLTGYFIVALLMINIVFGMQRFKPFGPLMPNTTDWSNVMIQAGLRVKNNTNLDPQVKVVAWSAGALGFLMPGRVINLDGLANDEVLKAKRAGKSEADIIVSLGRVYFVDLLPNFLGDPRLQSRLIEKIPFPAMGDYYLYEIWKKEP